MQTIGTPEDGGWRAWTYPISAVEPGSIIKVAITTPAFTTIHGEWPSITVGDDEPVEQPQATITNVQVNTDN